VPSVGKLKDLEVTVVGPGLIRLDFFASTPPDHIRDDRHTTVIDLSTARAIAILLIQSIEQAEVSEARFSKQRKKL
jgi:hypothetical protein